MLFDSPFQTEPDYRHEHELKARGARIVAGVDEAGRGPLAGPVVAGAVVLGKLSPSGLDDSKKLSAKRRAALEAVVRTAVLESAGPLVIMTRQ